MSNEREHYTMGYGNAATTIMSMRTAASHAAFFLPYLAPAMRVLDCGCGPGTITIGLAQAVAPGEAIGTEIEAAHVQLAQENAQKQQVKNVRFETADLYELPFPDSSFDAVFISAVLANLREPIRGVLEAHRVLKAGGVIGIKDFDHGGDLLHPNELAIQKYGELYQRLRVENGHDPQMGRKIGALLLEAEFEILKFNATYESFSTGGRAQIFAEFSTGLLREQWGDVFLKRKWATQDELNEMAAAWSRFAQTPGAMFGAAWCEAVARK